MPKTVKPIISHVPDTLFCPAQREAGRVAGSWRIKTAELRSAPADGSLGNSAARPLCLAERLRLSGAGRQSFSAVEAAPQPARRSLAKKINNKRGPKRPSLSAEQSGGAARDKGSLPSQAAKAKPFRKAVRRFVLYWKSV